MLHALRRSHTTATLALSPTNADAPTSPALPAARSPPNRASSAVHIITAADPTSPGGSSSAGDRSELSSPGAHSLRSTAIADSIERPWTRGDAPRHAYSLESAFAYLNYGHRERQHIFRLCTKAHGAFFFQALTANDAVLWCGRGASGAGCLASSA